MSKEELMLYKDGYVIRRHRLFHGYDYRVYDIRNKNIQYVKKISNICIGRDPYILDHLKNPPSYP